MTQIQEIVEMNKKSPLGLFIGAALAVVGLSTAVAGEAALDGAQLYQTKACSSCHGADGRTPLLPIYPKVAGQNAGYTFNQLNDIKNGSRNNGQAVVMTGIMAGVSEEEIRAIADWLATQ
jgi:cytochrome c